MPYSVPTTITTAQLVTADLMNTDWVENIKFLANPPACRVYHNADQSIANASWTVLAMNSERFDTDSMHNTVTNNSRITIRTAGLYCLTANLSFPTNGTGNRLSRLLVNGATEICLTSLAGNPAGLWTLSISTIYKFAVNDYAELWAFQSSGAALNVNSSADYSPEFSAVWLGLG